MQMCILLYYWANKMMMMMMMTCLPSQLGGKGGRVSAIDQLRRGRAYNVVKKTLEIT